MTGRHIIGKWLNEQPNSEIDRVQLAQLIAEYDEFQVLLEASVSEYRDIRAVCDCACCRAIDKINDN